MSEEYDSLPRVTVDKWSAIRDVYLSDWPRGVTGYYALQTQLEWVAQGIDDGFKVFCPFGEPSNGMVAVMNDKQSYAMIIECPSDDTKKLEEALKETKNINWRRQILILFVSKHVRECITRVADHVNVNVVFSPLKLYVLEKDNPLFVVSLPDDMTFKPLSFDHIALVDSKWPHRYPGSNMFFEFLIRAKQGYGLFKNSELIAWIFIKKIGALGHLYTLEDHRRKGYGETTLKLLCNVLLEKNKSVYSFCLIKNVASCSLHEKLGFSEVGDVASCYLTTKE